MVRIRTVTVVVAMVLAVIAAPCVPVAAGPPIGPVAPSWAQDGYGPQNSGYNPDERSLRPGHLRGLAQRWTIAATGDEVCAHQAAPVIDHGRIFLTGREGLGSYDAGTGHQIWTFPYADPMDVRTPLLAVSPVNRGTLLVATAGCQSASDPDGDLFALDPATGAVRWHQHTDWPDYVLTVDRGAVVVAGADAGSLGSIAFSIATGGQLWQEPYAMPAAGVSAGGRMLLTHYTSAVWPDGATAVDMATGRPLWHSAQPWSVRAADPSGTSFLAGGPRGGLARINAVTGAVLWSQPGLDGPLAVSGRTIFVARSGPEPDVISVDLASGRPGWISAGFAGPFARPVVAGGVVYVVSTGERLDMIAVADGRRLGFVAASGPNDHAVVAGGWLYLGDGSTLRAYTVPRIVYDDRRRVRTRPATGRPAAR